MVRWEWLEDGDIVREEALREGKMFVVRYREEEGIVECAALSEKEYEEVKKNGNEDEWFRVEEDFTERRKREKKTYRIYYRMGDYEEYVDEDGYSEKEVRDRFYMNNAYGIIEKVEERKF